MVRICIISLNSVLVFQSCHLKHRYSEKHDLLVYTLKNGYKPFWYKTCCCSQVGPYVSYSTLALVAGSVPVIFLLTFSWMPESPYYFLMQGKKDEARESLRWLRGDAGKGDLETEINKMEENVKSQMQNKGTMMDIFATHANRKAFFIVEVSRLVVIKFYGTSYVTLMHLCNINRSQLTH